MLQAADALEVILRFAAALSLTASAILLGHGLSRGLLRPHAAWVYVLIVALLATAWRWVIAWLSIPAHASTAAAIQPWVQQINQAVYVLIGMALCVLVIVGTRRRSDDP